jgi:sulfatase maturation enzyme AslB (radical SAM superfamily)
MSKDLKFYVLEHDYNIFAGVNWPSYNDYINGIKSESSEIQNEIDEFTEKQIKLGIKGKFLLNIEHTINQPEQDNDLEYKQRSSNLPSIKTGITNTCNVPWNIITVDVKGRVFICNCDGHVPFPIGHVLDFETFNDIFTSAPAQKIQLAVKNKTFEYCAVDFCGIRSSDLQYPTNQIKINITFDISCNIQCPSCRERKIFVNDPDMINSKLELGNRIEQWIKTTNKTVLVEFAGGEPLASLVYSKMFDQYSKNDNVKFILRTNGLLIRNNINLITKLKDRLNFSISIDAASKDTYEQKTRLGGRWEHLIEGLEIVKNLKISATGNFVIQKNNLHEVVPFVNFCQIHNLTPSFLMLQDWGTWHDYRVHCVHFPDSDLYNDFKIAVKELQKLNVDVSDMLHWIQ